MLGPVVEEARTVEVDGEPLEFVGLAAGDAWALRAVHRGYGLTIFGSGAPPEPLLLASIDDMEPYIQGSPH